MLPCSCMVTYCSCACSLVYLTHLRHIDIVSISQYMVNIVSISYRNVNPDIESSVMRLHKWTSISFQAYRELRMTTAIVSASSKVGRWTFEIIVLCTLICFNTSMSDIGCVQIQISEQSDQSDLLKFVQIQLRAKRFAFKIKSRSARRRLRKIWLHGEIFVSHAHMTHVT